MSLEEYEEQKQYNLHQTEIKYSRAKIEFIEPTDSDYLHCETNSHEVEKCSVVKRIIHLLHYQQQNLQVYEYLTSLPKYDLPTFMEDWHQVKKHHIRGKNEGVRIRNNMGIECVAINCQYFERYQTQRRGNELYDDMKIEIDYQNIILKNQ
eukprot:41359_1